MMNKNVIGGLVTVLVLVMMISLFSVSVFGEEDTPRFGPAVTLGQINDTDIDGNIEISWNNSQAASRYLILRSDVGNITNVSAPNNVSVIQNKTQKIVGNVSALAASGQFNKTFFEDNTTIHGVRYFYAIVPVNSSGGINQTHGTLVFGGNITHPFVAAGPWRSINSSSNDTFLPEFMYGSSPITLTSLNSTTINVTWTGITQDVNGNAETNVTYLVFRTASRITERNITNKSIQIVNTTSLFYQDQNLNASTDYYYSVATYDDAGNYNNGSNRTVNTSRLTSWTTYNISRMPAHKNLSGFTAAIDNGSKLAYMFGGYIGNPGKYTREFYIINFTNRSLDANLTNTTAGITARNHGGMVFDHKNGTFYYFGGYNGTWLGEMWSVNTSRASYWTNETWTAEAAFQPATGGMIYPKMFYRWNGTGGYIYSIGGYNQSSRTINETFFEYDVYAKNWRTRNISKQSSVVNNITNRWGQSLVYVPHNTTYRPDDVVIMFGGRETQGVVNAGNRWTNHTFMYNFTSQNWTQYFMHKGRAPLPRDFAQMEYEVQNDLIKLRGGRNGSANVSDFNKTWAFNLTSKTWNLTSYAETSYVTFGGVMVQGGSTDELPGEPTPRFKLSASVATSYSNQFHENPTSISPSAIDEYLPRTFSVGTFATTVPTPTAGTGGSGSSPSSTTTKAGITAPIPTDTGLGVTGSYKYTTDQTAEKADTPPKLDVDLSGEKGFGAVDNSVTGSKIGAFTGAFTKLSASLVGAPKATKFELAPDLPPLEKECNYSFLPELQKAVDCSKNRGKVVDVPVINSCTGEEISSGGKVSCSKGGLFWFLIKIALQVLGLDSDETRQQVAEGIDTATDSGDTADAGTGTSDDGTLPLPSDEDDSDTVSVDTGTKDSGTGEGSVTPLG